MVWAVPAHPGTIKVQQPDASYVTLRLVGDEWCHFNTTLDGYSVVKSNRGFYVYAEKKNGQLLPTSHVAHDVTSRSADEQAFLAGVKKYQAPEMSASIADMKARVEAAGALRRAQGQRATNYKNFKGLIVLVQFNDKEFSRPDYKDVITDMVNKEDYAGFDKQKMTGSVRDYFSDNSDGKFQPQFDVVGPYTVDFSQYDCNIQSGKCDKVLFAALDSADVDVNFKDYDGDGDKRVDLVFFIIAGNGANYQGNDENLWWPHRSVVWSGKQSSPYVYKDGVMLWDYASSVELYGYIDKPSTVHIDGIGTICHEFSHVLGLPDFYDSNYEEDGQSITPGAWSVMDAGCYQNDGFTPVGYSLYERYSVGFIDEPKKIEGEGTYTLNPLCSSQTGLRIDSPVRNEFFLLENRQKKAFKWDAYLPGSGMLVYRVDKTNSSVWTGNTVNANPDHNYYELVRACGNDKITTYNTATAYDPFPGQGNVTTLHNATAPANLKTWSGKATKWGLFNISQNNGVISFEVQDALTLKGLSLPVSVEVPLGGSRLLKVVAEPDYAVYTLKWNSDNPSIATVNEKGFVQGISEGTCTITATSANGIQATCQVSVVNIPNYDIAQFKKLPIDSVALLNLVNAEVTYVNGKQVYIRDRSGALILNDMNLRLERNNIVTGMLYAKVGVENMMSLALATDDTSADGLTILSGLEVQPREVQFENLTEADYSDYVVVKAVKLVKDGGAWAVSGDKRARLWNKFNIKGIKVPSDYNGNYFDVQAVYGTDVVNGTLIDELYLTSALVKVDSPTGITDIPVVSSSDGAVYNLQGQRVSPNTKGLLIRNGRKCLSK